MSENGQTTGLLPIAAGAGLTVFAHLFLVLGLVAASTSDGSDSNHTSSIVQRADGGHNRRGPHGFLPLRGRRIPDGPVVRKRPMEGNAFNRRGIYSPSRRRFADEEYSRSYRGIVQGRGRKSHAWYRSAKPRGIDWGAQAAPQVLEAMLVPRLGLKDPDKNELPRLVKYEQPEKAQDGVNISITNPDGTPISFKDFEKKEAQLDKRRPKKKATLDDLIAAPDDDDERKSPSKLDKIVGRSDGSVHGDGTVGKEGDAYLMALSMALKEAFVVPTFLSAAELASMYVEVEIKQIDSTGYIRAYRVVRSTGSQAFTSAALQAVKRFVPAEGGTKALPVPPPALLPILNRQGILIRLDGRRIQ